MKLLTHHHQSITVFYIIFLNILLLVCNYSTVEDIIPPYESFGNITSLPASRTSMTSIFHSIDTDNSLIYWQWQFYTLKNTIKYACAYIPVMKFGLRCTKALDLSRIPGLNGISAKKWFHKKVFLVSVQGYHQR